MSFPTSYTAILERIQKIDPAKYAKTRNFKDGAVTRLSPYISRGVISTKQVYEYVQSLDLAYSTTEKLVQELAWRDYWQQVWIAKGDAINQDLKRPQEDVHHHEISSALLENNTGIEAVDEALEELKTTGYMHNHMRMYVAAIACNFGGAHWHHPAQWMYYHLLDGDWASNALSWQWVAGSNAGKKYVANQGNINKYWNSNQRNTFLDKPYEDFPLEKIPKNLQETERFEPQTQLPKTENPQIDSAKPTCVYNYYNLDPNWHKDEDCNRILLLEPSTFANYPVSDGCIQFVLDLAENIPNIQVFTGEWKELAGHLNLEKTYYKEHPLNGHYEGIEEPRDWMFPVTGYYRSFFAFWKQCQKTMK